MELILILVYLTIFIVFSVSYVNGWTDAPNSIAACVATNVVPIKKAVKFAALADFSGSLTIGLLSGKVSERIIKLTEYDGNSDLFLISMFSAMLSVVIWAVTAWYFGIPTSESHAMLAGVLGSSTAINNGFGNINIEEWRNTAVGLLISVVVGFLAGFILSEFIYLFFQKKSKRFLGKLQIISSVLTAFLHGAQDSQKFVGIIMAVLYKFCSGIKFGYLYFIITFLCAAFISLGTATGGERIIKTVGSDMVKLSKEQGFSADISGLICLLISTLCGIPVSTTHIKTASILGAGAVNGDINWKTAGKMLAAWVLTFPVCALISYIITFVMIK